MGLGFDWDGDGVESEDDDMFTQLLVDEDLRKLQKKSGNSSCMVIFLIPVLAIGLMLKLKGLV